MNVCASIEDKPDDTKDNLYEEMDHPPHHFPALCIPSLLDDLNATSGEKRYFETHSCTRFYVKLLIIVVE